MVEPQLLPVIAISSAGSASPGDAIKMGEAIGAATVDLEWVQALEKAADIFLGTVPRVTYPSAEW